MTMSCSATFVLLTEPCVFSPCFCQSEQLTQTSCYISSCACVIACSESLTCFSSNSTILFSSTRFLLVYLIAMMFPWKQATKQHSLSYVSTKYTFCYKSLISTMRLKGPTGFTGGGLSEDPQRSREAQSFVGFEWVTEIIRALMKPIKVRPCSIRSWRTPAGSRLLSSASRSLSLSGGKKHSERKKDLADTEEETFSVFVKRDVC